MISTVVSFNRLIAILIALFGEGIWKTPQKGSG